MSDPLFKQDFDAATGQITWTMIDEQGDEFTFTIDPDTSDQSKLYVAWTLPGGTSYSYTFR